MAEILVKHIRPLEMDQMNDCPITFEMRYNTTAACNHSIRMNLLLVTPNESKIVASRSVRPFARGRYKSRISAPLLSSLETEKKDGVTLFLITASYRHQELARLLCAMRFKPPTTVFNKFKRNDELDWFNDPIGEED